jgi:VIT1/CCC1 family predicted Fe2+/Mn2+ transporter
LLAAAKVRGLSVYTEGKVAVGHPMPTRAEDIGRRHRPGGASGSLRAAVFGVNDGLVSNASLIMGVAGAGPEPRVILLAGLAGLLAGAFSMAAGEYVSMRSQRELFEHQIAEERDELERYPEEEAEELAIIYEARGVPLEEARRFARSMLGDREEMLNTLAREELGLNPDELGSPLAAALSSFVAFALGASLPLLPFLLSGVERPVPLAAGLAAVGLFLIGAALSLFSGRSALAGGARMLALGAVAAAATWGIGSLVGATVA